MYKWTHTIQTLFLQGPAIYDSTQKVRWANGVKLLCSSYIFRKW